MPEDCWAFFSAGRAFAKAGQRALVSRALSAVRRPGEEPDPLQLDGSFSGGTGLCLRLTLPLRLGLPPRSAKTAASAARCRCLLDSSPGDAAREARDRRGRPSEFAFAADSSPGLSCRRWMHP